MCKPLNKVQSTCSSAVSFCGTNPPAQLPKGLRKVNVSASICGGAVTAHVAGKVSRDSWVALSAPRMDFCKQCAYISVTTSPAKGKNVGAGPKVVDFARDLMLPIKPSKARGPWTIYLTDSSKPGKIIAETTVKFAPACCHSSCCA